MISIALTIALAQINTVAHEFVYMDSKARTVSVAGTFNNWNKDSDPLKLSPDGKSWRTTKGLTVGKHQYKFVVDGDKWIPDPMGVNKDDGYGNINSFLSIVPMDFSMPAIRGDGVIAKSVLRHDPKLGDVVFDSETATARFLVRTRKGDVAQVELSLDEKVHPMTRVGGDDNVDIYSVSAKVKNPESLSYSIKLKDGNGSAIDLKNDSPVDANEFAEPTVPSWTRSAVYYQIFPDRFENGSKANDPANVQPWDGQPTYSNFMGGDLAGIAKRADYLSKLGVTGIYLNPIFKGPSNHGYETTDYMQIEPRLGSNNEFIQLTKELKAQGIGVVLDGVFNHTSVDFAQFKEILEKGKDASTLDWYTIKSFPVVPKADPPYEAWAGHASLPKLNLKNPATKQYIFDVVKFWDQNAEIAGWRLDVANEIPMPFWREFRTLVKTENPNTWIIGENWTDSSQWLKGDQWDSAMNYPLRGAILNHIALGTTSSSEFLDALMTSYLMYGPHISGNMLNSLSTHDVPRFKNFAKDDDSLNQMGAVALFAWPGVPCIYYGDELGMTGGIDPDNRRGMRWDLNTSDNSTLKLYQKLIRARRGSVALQVGEPIPLFSDDTKQISVFARVASAEVAIACFNRSPRSQTVELDVSGLNMASTQSLVDVVSGKVLDFSGGGRLRLRIPGKSALLAISGTKSEPLGVQRNQDNW
jgi:cyclomaltodextrinase / maltogenic alpha-amylase / neopullulanase